MQGSTRAPRWTSTITLLPTTLHVQPSPPPWLVRSIAAITPSSTGPKGVARVFAARKGHPCCLFLTTYKRHNVSPALAMFACSCCRGPCVPAPCLLAYTHLGHAEHVHWGLGRWARYQLTLHSPEDHVAFYRLFRQFSQVVPLPFLLGSSSMSANCRLGGHHCWLLCCGALGSSDLWRDLGPIRGLGG